MNLLRFTQDARDGDRYRVEVALEGAGPRRVTRAEFEFRLTAQDQADLRWYLEDYLQRPHEPAPQVAARIEGRMEELGTGLFRKVFEGDDAGRRLWYAASEALPATRVEVVTTVEGATAVPWELLREPGSEAPVALFVHSFVRAQPDARRMPRVVPTAADRVRILLVICRPWLQKDVPFRPVATRILKGLDESSRRAFDLDVLRPPSFEELARTLRRASTAGEPYHVLHFDGHGGHLDLASYLGRLRVGGQPIRPLDAYPRQPRPGKHGYLIFERPGSRLNRRFVDGPELAALLVEAGVPVLVLNSCRSAYAEVKPKPETVEESPADGEAEAEDPHQVVRALGSLAQELMDSGVGGVVAMRYNVYVDTAARFVAELYGSLARGQSLGAAVALGRKHLHDEPLREIVADPLPLQDWQVPIVYEAAPIALFPEPREGAALEIKTDPAAAADLASSLPATPDAGFYGRDKTLLALDRAFDDQKIVLLHAYAGSGKTATAAEFARWYHLTGGIGGPVLFTSFEHHKPLSRVLDDFGEVFAPMLERSGVHWLAITDQGRRRDVALQALGQVPVLWIWDNVEPVTGFPAGTESAWTDAEQNELVDFLRACRDTRTRLLLTSRRDERAWLGDLPARIRIPSMPMTERRQLARALAAKRGRTAEATRDWEPLLEFSAGNPLTLTVLVGQALRDGLEGRNAVQDFVDRLRAGEAAFEDEAGEGRSRSLGASLSYGFEHAFDEEERRRLALLHLFQGFVDVDTLRIMGHPEMTWCLPDVRGLGHQDAVALLDRAAEIGLLRSRGTGRYGIHPALPWFLQGLFERFHGAERRTATRAFVEAMGEMGNKYHNQYEQGNRDVIEALCAEEANLLQARRLARIHGWWSRVASAMQGLRQLYGQTGRRAEWRRLVQEIVPDFVDSETEGPLPGREDLWNLMTQYRAGLAMAEQNWDEAERLQQGLVDWERRRAAPVLRLPRRALDGTQHITVRWLAVSLERLGNIWWQLGREDCVEIYEEALELSESIGDRAEVASCAFNLGRAYQALSAIRDLQQAEHWYRRSLRLRDEGDRIGRGRSLGQLGFVAYERYQEARAQERPEEELGRHLRQAARLYRQVLGQFPANAVDDLAVSHNQLGMIYGEMGDVDRAVRHYRDGIRYQEQQGNVWGASLTRENVAITLTDAGRSQDGLEYAKAALRGFEKYGGASAAERIQQTRQLIGRIEQKIE